jgi:hypothetical protein
MRIHFAGIFARNFHLQSVANQTCHVAAKGNAALGGTGFSLCDLDPARAKFKPHRLKPVPPQLGKAGRFEQSKRAIFCRQYGKIQFIKRI